MQILYITFFIAIDEYNKKSPLQSLFKLKNRGVIRQKVSIPRSIFNIEFVQILCITFFVAHDL